MKDMEVPAPPDETRSTSFPHRHLLAASRTKQEEDVSPKSVISAMRFLSPASSSSSSMERRVVSDASNMKQWQPRHDRGYSISDGEFSDPDTFTDSTGVSRELAKVGNSGPLESLPETHSLALEAVRPTVSLAAEVSASDPSSDWEDSDLNCCGRSSSASNGPVSSNVHGDQVEFLERPSGVGSGENRSIITTRAIFQNEFRDGNQEISRASTRSNSGMHSGSSEIHTSTSVSGFEDEDQHHSSEWSQTATSCESASDPDGKESSCSTANYTESESESQPKEPQSTRTKLQGGLSPNVLEDRAEDAKRRVAAHGQNVGMLAYPGTPLRSFPGWQPYAGSPPVGSNLILGSPRTDKGTGSYSPASLSETGRGIRSQQRFLSGPLLTSMISKPPPSKWDDAEKWIASPGHHQESPAHTQLRPVQAVLSGRRHSIAGQGLRSYYGVGSPEYTTSNGEKPSSPDIDHTIANSGRPPSLTHSASQKKRSKTLSFGDLSRRFDLSRSTGKPPSQPEDIISRKGIVQEVELMGVPKADHQSIYGNGNHGAGYKPRGNPESPTMASKLAKPECSSLNKLGTGTPSACTNDVNVQTPKHGRSISMKEIGTDPSTPPAPPTPEAPSSHRDMGTQMTPIESLRNSTCTTPGFITSPTRHNTPARSGRRSASLGAIPGAESLELKSCHLAKLELRKLAGDGQPTLDRNMAWTTRAEEDLESSASLRQYDLGNFEKGVLAARATAWEEAEQTKYTARYNREEAKINAWEELQKAKAEAEMQKIEIKAERSRADANEKMLNRVALATQKAEEMRAAAQGVRTEQASKISQRAEQIRTTGCLSPPFRYSFTCCFAA